MAKKMNRAAPGLAAKPSIWLLLLCMLRVCETTSIKAPAAKQCLKYPCGIIHNGKASGERCTEKYGCCGNGVQDNTNHEECDLGPIVSFHARAGDGETAKAS